MALPANYILDGIRSLRGKGKVSYPEGNKRIERITTVPKDDWELTIHTVDPDHTDCLLTEQTKLSEDAKYAEVYRVYDKIPGTILTGETVTQEGQLGTIATQLVDPSTTVSPSATTVSAKVTPVGAGKSVKEVITVPTVFDNKQVSLQKNAQIPDKFLLNGTRVTTAVTSAGTSVDSITLTGDEVAKAAERLDMNKVRVTTTEKPLVALQEVRSAKMVEEYGGAIATVTEHYYKSGDTVPSLPEDYNVISAGVEALPGGAKLMTTVTVPKPMPVLAGRNWDDVRNVPMPFNVQVVDATDPDLLTNHPHAEVTPIDQWRSRVTSTDTTAITTLLETWQNVYSAQPSVVLPDFLESIVAHYHVGGNSGTGSGGGSGTSYSNHLDGSCNATVDCELEVRIKEGHRGPIQGQTVEFFVPEGGDAMALCLSRFGASPWPVWNLVNHSIVIHGESKAARMSVVNSYTEAGSSHSKSQDHGGTPRIGVRNIPGTIHNLIVIGADCFVSGKETDVTVEPTYNVNPNGYKATATAEIVYRVPGATEDTVIPCASAVAKGWHAPTELASSMPLVWPGKVVFDLNVSPYKYGWSLARAIFVDLSPYNPSPPRGD